MISAILMLCLFFFFFFSSRRRHTRFDCDWSSDVCSSDLEIGPCGRNRSRTPPPHRWGDRQIPQSFGRRKVRLRAECAGEIGRASCRERVEITGVGGALKKKRKKKGDNYGDEEVDQS